MCCPPVFFGPSHRAFLSNSLLDLNGLFPLGHVKSAYKPQNMGLLPVFSAVSGVIGEILRTTSSL